METEKQFSFLRRLISKIIMWLLEPAIAQLEDANTKQLACIYETIDRARKDHIEHVAELDKLRFRVENISNILHLTTDNLTSEIWSDDNSNYRSALLKQLQDAVNNNAGHAGTNQKTNERDTKMFKLDLTHCKKRPAFLRESDPKIITITPGVHQLKYDLVEEELPKAIVSRWRKSILGLYKNRYRKVGFENSFIKWKMKELNSYPIGFDSIPDGATLHEL